MVIDELREPEVGDPDVPGWVEDQVRRFHIAVKNALLVGVVQGVGGLKPDLRDERPVAIVRTIFGSVRVRRQESVAGDRRQSQESANPARRLSVSTRSSPLLRLTPVSCDDS